MQKKSFYINKHLAGHDLVETALSFKPFVNHLQKRRPTDDTIKARFYSFALEHFESETEDIKASSDEGVPPNEHALELIYSALSPVLLSEEECYWALSTPVPNQILYSTDSFYKLITSKDIREASSSIITNDDMFRKQQLEYIYRLILKRLYGFTSVLSNNIYYSYVNADTGLSRYYHINIDTTFIEIEVKGKLPELDFETIENYLHEDTSVEVLTEVLPLSLFKFEGFSVISLEDVTARKAIEDIRDAITDPVEDQKELYRSVIQSLKTLSESNHVCFGLLPFIKLNGQPLFDLSSCSESILMQSARKYGVAEETYNALVSRYEKEPKAVFFSSISETRQQKFFFLKTLRDAGIKSYAVIPVFYNKHIAGVMEVYSEKELVFYENLLSRLEFAIPLIAQLLQNSIEYFNACIDDVIRDKFTSLQPAVQWKFNEVAWEQIKNPKARRRRTSQTLIEFKDVYPLYGAIDIRNSTIERNIALQNDLKRVIKLLLKILHILEDRYPGKQWQPLTEKASDWLQVVEKQVNTSDEMLINEFLESEAGLTLANLRTEHPESGEIVDRFLEMIAQDCEGPAFTQRNRLETAMQMINATISNYFEQAEKQLQQIYPCYFEKFRTDGVEYDVYVGQAIAPKQPFAPDFLKQMRMWQLTSMVEVSRLTHNLLDHMPASLQTTQLIFIHSVPIDISFRNDERRFDVEGAYNIRYEVIKKRIDKVLLKDSDERLTQPGKIALVYFTEAEADEQLTYIKQLQAQKMLQPEVEKLDLEELQGVVGLKALRVSINFEE
ncbi:GAF domain-containing protein [Mucilaginibacter sp. PAMB04274]|uniref:GAF domain-containing protein n=1 Tax=Mucilaginibacter sp. PAMB04274 TaxID=3138568 RepID=UPI0031F6FDDF